MPRRKLQELNVLEDFLFGTLISHPVWGEPFSRTFTVKVPDGGWTDGQACLTGCPDIGRANPYEHKSHGSNATGAICECGLAVARARSAQQPTFMLW